MGSLFTSWFSTQARCERLSSKKDMCVWLYCVRDVLYVTQRQLMRLFAVKLILGYEQKFKVRSKFLKN